MDCKKIYIGAAILVTGLCLTASIDAQHSYYIDGQIGLGLNTLKTNSIIADPDNVLPDTRLDTNGGATAFADFGLRAGMIHPIKQNLSLEMGLGLYASRPQTLTGKTQVMVGDPWDASYKYHVNTTRLMLESRLYFRTTCRLSYFGGIGLGVGQIYASALSYTAIDSGFVAPQVSSVTQNRSAISGVLGADYVLNQHWHIEGAVSKLWLGANKVYVNMGAPKGFLVTQGHVDPWKLSVALSYRF